MLLFFDIGKLKKIGGFKDTRKRFVPQISFFLGKFIQKGLLAVKAKKSVV